MRKLLFILLIATIATSLFSSGLSYKRGGAITGLHYEFQNEKYTFKNLSAEEVALYDSVKYIPYQLPEDLLSSFTVYELIMYCGDHPSFVEQRYPGLGVCDETLADFNGYQELIKRDHYFEELLQITKHNRDIPLKDDVLELYCRLLLSKTLYDHLGTGQKITLFECLKENNKSIAFVAIDATRIAFFLTKCSPEDADEWLRCFRFETFTHYEYTEFSIDDYFDSKIMKLRGEEND